MFPTPAQSINTDMRAVRKDYFLDHDHSCYVDQWDWEKVIEPKDRTLGNLKETVRQIWSSLVEAADEVRAYWMGGEGG